MVHVVEGVGWVKDVGLGHPGTGVLFQLLAPRDSDTVGGGGAKRGGGEGRDAIEWINCVGFLFNVCMLSA